MAEPEGGDGSSAIFGRLRLRWLRRKAASMVADASAVVFKVRRVRASLVVLVMVIALTGASMP
jgi:hypothetical protein